MSAEEIEELNQRLMRAKEEFRPFASYVPYDFKGLADSTLKTMAAADDAGYSALPERVRSLINERYLLPIGYWHQMFGRGVEIQGDSCAMREEGNIMLLQLTHDDLLQLDIGDNGIYQFWISPSDLSERNWNNVKITCECH
jgi:hypothetical protein